MRSHRNKCRTTAWRGLAAVLIMLLAPPAAMPASAQTGDILVFAAASLRDALDTVAAQYRQDTGKAVKISYGASSALAKQIEAGAPADIFISADLDWMDYVAQRHLIVGGTRKNILGNRLVLVTAKDDPVQVRIAPGFPLADLLKGGRLAMADTNAVPAGKYGKAALEKLRVWSSVSGSIAQAENVRAALVLVSRQEAPFGIVYQTDAAADPNVRIAGIFPEDTHPPIIYPIARVAASRNADAARLLAYIEAPQAAPAFERQGFTVLK